MRYEPRTPQSKTQKSCMHNRPRVICFMFGSASYTATSTSTQFTACPILCCQLAGMMLTVKRLQPRGISQVVHCPPRLSKHVSLLAIRRGMQCSQSGSAARAAVMVHNLPFPSLLLKHVCCQHPASRVPRVHHLHTGDPPISLASINAHVL